MKGVDMPMAGSARPLGRGALAIFWTVMLVLLLGCSEAADPLDARFLRRQFPEQADAILQGPFAFTLAGDAFESLRTVDALAGLSGETGPRSRFPRGGDGAVRFPLPDGSEVELPARCRTAASARHPSSARAAPAPTASAVISAATCTCAKRARTTGAPPQAPAR
ncbi:hypothetical protein WME99_04640 [Sorangium sp. So ce136]|uniref:hypothetical protein n=1 Tax=Sorangium sp. So ce136 TaxID=3133284 RepID=UPI003F0F14C7